MNISKKKNGAYKTGIFLLQVDIVCIILFFHLIIVCNIKMAEKWEDVTRINVFKNSIPSGTSFVGKKANPSVVIVQ